MIEGSVCFSILDAEKDVMSLMFSSEYAVIESPFEKSEIFLFSASLLKPVKPELSSLEEGSVVLSSSRVVVLSMNAVYVVFSGASRKLPDSVSAEN